MDNDKKNNLQTNSNDDLSQYTLHNNSNSSEESYDFEDSIIKNNHKIYDDNEFDFLQPKINKKQKTILKIQNDYQDIESSIEKQTSVNPSLKVVKGSDFLELVKSKIKKPQITNEDIQTKNQESKQNESQIENSFLNYQETKQNIKNKLKNNKNEFKKQNKFNDYFNDDEQENYLNFQKTTSKTNKNQQQKEVSKIKVYFKNDFDINSDYSTIIAPLESNVESLIYVSGEEGISIDDLSKVCEISKEKLLFLLNNIQQKNQNDNAGVSLVKFGNKFKFVTQPKNKQTIVKYVSQKPKKPLNKNTLEVLAIIAYNGFATRSMIEKVRAVDPKSSIDTLLKVGLIKDGGYLKTPGRPTKYIPTQKFFDSFGLQSKKELPKLDREFINFEENNEEYND